MEQGRKEDRNCSKYVGVAVGKAECCKVGNCWIFMMPAKEFFVHKEALAFGAVLWAETEGKDRESI